MAWLLKPDVVRKMQLARELAYQPTLEERAKFAAQMHEAYASKAGEQPRNMQVVGSVAEIAIDGVLTEKPDCFALIFGDGNTTYESIRKALALAEADPLVKSIQLNISSPGGHVTGLFETFAALRAVTKPGRVRASLAASAAYGLAAVSGWPIEAVTPGSEFGSIGVAVRMWLDEDAVDLASTEAPKKRPDLTSEEGRAAVVEELDAFHDLFVSDIAEGRSAATGEKVTAATVNKEFGRGGVLLAGAARKQGLIDRIAAQPKRAATAGKRASVEDNEVPQAPGERTMNLETLKAQHPELYKFISDEAKEAGRKEGVTAERDRVVAHLTLGEASGDMKTATEAIRSGDAMTATVQAKYMAASMNRRDTTARQQESAHTEAVLNGATPPNPGAPGATTPGTADGGPDLGDKIVAILEQQRGTTASNGAPARA
jgi:capsid assembly protease